MLPQKHRFHGRAALRRVFLKGQTKRSRNFIIKYVATQPDRPTRVAVVVSKKIYKSAVKRNRIRRRIFNIVRHEQKLEKLGYDTIITVISQDVLLLPHDDLIQEITKLVTRLQYIDVDRS